MINNFMVEQRMRSKAISVVLALLMLTIAAGVFADGPEKVDVCHKAGSVEQAEISIAGPALDAHLAHGDYEGNCPDLSGKSELCSILDGLDGTFVSGESVDFSQVFQNTSLYDSEIVTITAQNEDIIYHMITGSIKSTGGQLYKSLSFSQNLRLNSGDTASAAFTNNSDPGLGTDFVLTIEEPFTGDGGEPLGGFVYNGSVYFVLSCS